MVFFPIVTINTLYLQPPPPTHTHTHTHTHPGSLVSQLPSLHFFVYVPKRSESPLSILPSSKSDQHTDTFLIPQWGGVVFYNHGNVTSDPDIVDVRMERVMPVFVKQLKLLLGIPSEVRVITVTNATTAGYSVQFSLQLPPISNVKLSNGPLGITDWVRVHVNCLDGLVCLYLALNYSKLIMCLLLKWLRVYLWHQRL